MSDVNIPDSVTSIERYAFLGCDSLIDITIPDSVIEIGQGAFAECHSLTSIIIPKNVASISAVAFGGEKLTSIEVDENNEHYSSIDGNLYDKDATTLVKYAQGKLSDSFTSVKRLAARPVGAASRHLSPIC